ncbi:MAG TPA: PQQ-binding-like beta-propeller repeat protein [Kofleriaceae bacterium]|nr:PQQ-binding-like beta-propeller repeat protein [Kofleriaceae bacterium]
MHRLAVIAVVAALSPMARADSLGQVWRVREPLGQVVVVGSRLVAITDVGFQILDAHDGRRGRMVVPASWGLPAAIAVAGGRIIIATADPGRVFGFAPPGVDGVEIAQRWEIPLAPRERAVRMAADPDLAVVEIQTAGDIGPVKRELVAIVGGAVAWRHEVGVSWAIEALSVHAGRVAAAGTFGGPQSPQAFALELGPDGRQRWSYVGDAATGFAVGDRFVAITRDPYLTIIDRAGGVSFDALIGPLGSPSVTIADDVAYVSGGPEDDKPGGIVAVGLADRRLRWRHAIDPDATSSIEISRTTVFVHASSDELVALDRTLGREIWRYGIGAMSDMVAVGDRIVVYDSERATAFGPVDAAAPVEDAVVTGKLALSCTHSDVVSVDGIDTPLRADGTFAAHVHARGAVSVIALTTRLKRVDLVGRHRYDVGALLLDRCED